jgi:hypothetical protein
MFRAADDSRQLPQYVVSMDDIKDSYHWINISEHILRQKLEVQKMSLKKYVLVLVLMSTLAVLMMIRPVLFQEGNPIPVLKGIAGLAFSDNEMVQISDDPVRYISVTGEGEAPMVALMEKEGWHFKEQAGSGYIFDHPENDRMVVVTGVLYTRRYRIWRLPY